MSEVITVPPGHFHLVDKQHAVGVIAAGSVCRSPEDRALYTVYGVAWDDVERHSVVLVRGTGCEFDTFVHVPLPEYFMEWDTELDTAPGTG